MSNEQNILAYGCDKYLVLRNLNDPAQSEIYNQNVENSITAVKFSPNGEYLAYGDDKGKYRVIERSKELGFNTVAEGPGIGDGPIMEFCWSVDPLTLVYVGSGKSRKVGGITLPAKASIGELLGNTKNLLTCDFNAEKVLAVTGEEHNVNLYK